MYDQGEYICVAENSVGRVDAAAKIVVVPDPNNRRCGKNQKHQMYSLTHFRGGGRRVGWARQSISPSRYMDGRGLAIFTFEPC